MFVRLKKLPIRRIGECWGEKNHVWKVDVEKMKKRAEKRQMSGQASKADVKFFKVLVHTKKGTSCTRSFATAFFFKRRTLFCAGSM